MSAIPAPTIILPREEWPDADFDLPEGAPIIHAQSDKDDEGEDWDMEMNLGETGKARLSLSPPRAPRNLSLELRSSISQPPVIIRPPIQMSDLDDDDDEGVSTIKASAPFPAVYAKASSKPLVEPIDEDFEEGLALPSDLTQLSLAPLSLQHRASKASLEWGDKDASCSSQSSDAYSSLGFADASPSSNSATSASLPDTENEEDEDQLDGLVLPTSLFESQQSVRQLKKILEMKKKTHYTPAVSKPSRINPDDDFEMGLVINDDVDLSPSRLVSSTHNQSFRNSAGTSRSSTSSINPQRSSSLRPPSRLRTDRAKSPTNPPTSSAKQLQKLRLSPSPPLRPPSRSQNFQALVSNLPIPSPPPVPNNFLSAKPGSLRGQKSHSGLKPPTPPSTARKLTRKASLSSLIESNHAQAAASPFPVVVEPKPARYEEATAASRAKTHKGSSSRTHDYKVPPTRPHTPSSNPAALRLTMPTQSRLKSRPALSQVFGSKETGNENQSAKSRATSPIPPRPPSSTSLRGSTSAKGSTSPVAPKLLRRPKRQRTYGDGTELDAFEDLPTDRDKEVRYRVQPKGYGNRVPGSSYSSKEKEKSPDYGTIRRKDSSLAPLNNTLRRTTTRIDLSQKVAPANVYAEAPPLPKKKKSTSSPTNSTTTRRKPTLIRNLGGTSAPKVVGDMKWNPYTLRWEGNDHVLREFDAAVGTSSRPALITHLSGSAMGSPVGSFSSGARKVGNMLFDPQRMCWISTLPPEEDEPDVFANLADDEEDGAWRSKGDTIRAIVPRISDASSVESTLSNSRADASSPTRSHSRSISESGSDRGSRASMVVGDVDDEFLARCREAEERHRTEMKGWKSSLTKRDTSLASDRLFLYEIRALATRKY